jgi:4-diphosphocytidyl-2-C-methyl-D-erythritol kinase
MGIRALYDVAAPAKLNAFLHVVGRRADGYHLLQSVFVLIDWCDSLHFERRADGRIARHDLGIALPADDLCLRAARALQAASGTPSGVDVSIDKRVPWAPVWRRQLGRRIDPAGTESLWDLRWRANASPTSRSASARTFRSSSAAPMRSSKGSASA